MNGKFEIDMTHKLDSELAQLGFKTMNPVAMELTKICIEQKKTPKEVLAIYKEIIKGLL